MSLAQQTITAQDFWQLPPGHAQRELVRGEVVEAMPPGGVHGAVAVAIASLLRQWARPAGGYVGVEAGFLLARNPDTVRGPDVSYVRKQRIPSTGVPEAFWEIPPDLAVEVVSPTETAEEVRTKVRDYLQAGTPLVWTIYLPAREVIAHAGDGTSRTISTVETLEFTEVLPGFQCAVAELFE